MLCITNLVYFEEKAPIFSVNLRFVVAE